ncbi:MAG: 6-carboxytetrahydropterin synthase [Phycisphaerales bacterium]
MRFAINPNGLRGAGEDDAVRGPNGYAGVPSIRGLGAHYELDVTCRGPIDPVSGYLINIKDVDASVRAHAIPHIARAVVAGRGPVEPARLLGEIFGPVDAALRGCVASLRWRLSPYHSLEMAKDAPTIVLVRQRFEFAASHRLHNPALSDDENRRLYGKCNHPSGHGHNYIVELCVESEVGPSGATGLSLAEIERIAGERVIDRFDHKHLNIDVPEFGPSGLNPSVENIARVAYELLAPAIAGAGGGAGGATGTAGRARLREVTVWETEKTGSTYPG